MLTLYHPILPLPKYPHYSWLFRDINRGSQPGLGKKHWSIGKFLKTLQGRVESLSSVGFHDGPGKHWEGMRVCNGAVRTYCKKGKDERPAGRKEEALSYALVWSSQARNSPSSSCLYRLNTWGGAKRGVPLR